MNSQEATELTAKKIRRDYNHAFIKRKLTGANKMPIDNNNHNNEDVEMTTLSSSSSLSDMSEGAVCSDDESTSSPGSVDSPLQTPRSESRMVASSTSTQMTGTLNDTDLDKINALMQKTVYRVIVRQMEHVRQERDKSPDTVIQEPVALIKALVTPEQSDRIKKAQESDQLACAVTYQMYSANFQVWICQTLSDVLDEQYKKPREQRKLKNINTAYQAALKEAKIGCISSTLDVLKERQGSFTYENKTYTVDPKDIAKALKQLKDTPNTFNPNKCSFALKMYLNKIIYPKVNEEVAVYNEKFTSHGEARAMLKICNEQIKIANEATENYFERINTYAMVTADTLQEMHLEKKERERGLFAFLKFDLETHKELTYHPTLGYKLKESEQKALLFEHPLPVNYQDGYHNTLLHHAFASQNFDVAYALIKQGANPQLKNHSGMSPSDYSTAPQRIVELTSIFQTDGQRAQSDVTKKLARILEKQKTRNESIEKWQSLHNSSLLGERKKETQQLEQLLDQSYHQYHDDEMMKQLKALHQSINTSWRGNSILKKRIGNFIKSIETGKIKSVHAEEYGRPVILAIPPELSLSQSEVNTRVLALENENRQLVQAVAKKDVQLKESRQRITTLSEKTATLEGKYHQTLEEATAAIATTKAANEALTQALQRESTLVTENQQLRVQEAQKTKALEKAQIAAQAAKKAADDVNAKYLDVSGRLGRFEKMLADLTARNDASSSATTSSGSGQGYSPRFMGAQ